MSTPIQASVPAAPSGFRRIAPALALYFIAPFVAECLLGDFSINAIAPYLAVSPMYGGGALLIREITRRSARGWPTMLLLALAYGLLEEGVVLQTLFNPNYLGLHLLAQGWIPSLGIGGWWTCFVLTIHVVWSISVPIALAEALSGPSRTRPWLGKVGLSVAAGLLVLGCLVNHRFTAKTFPFTASTAQLLSVSILIVAVVGFALKLRRAPVQDTRRVPSAPVVGTVALALGLLFMGAHGVLHDWPLAGAQLVIDLAAAGLLLNWSRRNRWTPRHTLAAAGGAMLTYAITAFWQPPVVGGKGAIALVSHILFGTIAVALLVSAVRTQSKFASETTIG